MSKSELFFEVRNVALSYAPFRWNHEPGVARLPGGDFLTVWGATGRGDFQSTKIVGSYSPDNGLTWGEPVLFASDPEARTSDPSLLVTGDKAILQYGVYPFGRKREGDPYFRYKSGTLMQRTFEKNAKSWSEAKPVNTGKVQCSGPNEGLALRDGTFIWPFQWELNCESGDEPMEKDMIDVSSIMRSIDGGRTWVKRGDVRVKSKGGADEPTVIERTNGDLFMLIRTTAGRLYQTVSRDKGDTWSEPEPSPLVSPFAPAALYRLSYEPSKVLVVWNNSPMNRYPLDVAVSYDDCRTWARSRTISCPGCQVSYPGIATAPDGTIVVVYQQWYETFFSDTSEYTDITADIKCARFNEAWVEAGPFISPRVV